VYAVITSMQPLVFFGTPEFAVPTLRALAATAASEFRPQLVVSQPSRPSGRGKRLTEPPVVVAARELGIPFEQVEKVKDPAFLARLAELGPEIAVVVAFGQIFPRTLLEIPRRSCVNLHASLLPRWRGAAPIQAAVRAGDAETGVTTMIMEAGLDSGPMLLERRTAIRNGETAAELSSRLADIGAGLMIETLRGLGRGSVVARVQESALATYAPKVTREEARTRWDMPAAEIERAVRAYQPWPGVELPFGAESVKVLRAGVADGGGVAHAEPGTVAGVAGDAVVVAAGGESFLSVSRAQRAGRGPVSGAELSRALGLRAGDRLA
jgi:methionyl-tRNA formyltransferase